MADTRMARRNWNVGDLSWDGAKVAVLMDLRDVLDKINGNLDRINDKLGCYRIQKMFQDINRIDKRLSKKIKLK